MMEDTDNVKLEVTETSKYSVTSMRNAMIDPSKTSMAVVSISCTFSYRKTCFVNARSKPIIIIGF